MFDRFRRRRPEKIGPETIKLSARQAPADVGQEESFTVDGPADDGLTFEINFPELVAWEEEERIDKLAALLNARPEIERAFREDREFILVEARGMELAALDTLVTAAWDDAAVGTQYRQFDDDGELVNAERSVADS